MMCDTYSEWIKRVESLSSFSLTRYLSCYRRDVDDWEGKAWTFYNDYKERGYKGVLFEGRRGTGKHTALASFLNAFSGGEGLGYKAIFLDPLTLPNDPAEYYRFESFVLEWITFCKDEQQNAVLVIDDIETCKCKQFVLKLLLTIVCNHSDDEFEVIYMITSNDVLETQSLFSEMTCRFVFAGTDPIQRKNYIELYEPDLKNIFDVNDLVEWIGECTYGELTNITRILSLEVSTGKSLKESDVHQVAEKYISAGYKKLVPHPVMDMFFDRLGSAFSSMPANVVGGTIQVNQNTDDKVSSGDSDDSLSEEDQKIMQKKKEYENMPPRDLMIHLFGEDGIRQIVDSISD